MAKRRASKGSPKGMKVKDLAAGGKKGRKVKGGGGGVPGLSASATTTSLKNVGAVGPCFRPTGVIAPCDRLR